MLSSADLLTFLSERGGREFEVQAAVQSGRGKKATTRELGAYRLTVRGEQVQATGPSGQTRLLTRAEFTEIFGTYRFTEPQPTGTLTDLGPLFG